MPALAAIGYSLAMLHRNEDRLQADRKLLESGETVIETELQRMLHEWVPRLRPELANDPMIDWRDMDVIDGAIVVLLFGLALLKGHDPEQGRPG